MAFSGYPASGTRIARLLPRGLAPGLALNAAALYAAFGMLWIAMSDRVGAMLFSTSEQLTRFQTHKGFVFVLASAILVYLLLRRGVPRGIAAADSGAPPRGRGLPLTVSLWLLVLATAFPLLAVMGAGLYRDTQRDVDKAGRFVNGLTDLSLVQVEAFHGELRRLADMLARRADVRAADASRCDPLFGEVAALHPGLANIFTTDSRGRVACAWDDAGALGAGWRMRSADAPSVSAPVLQEDGTGGVVVFSYPMAPVRGAAGHLHLAVRLSAFHPMVASALPEGAVATIIDSEGFVVARTVRAEQLAGKHMPDERLVQRILRERTGGGVAAGLDGVERLYALREARDAGWFILTGVPVDALYAPARASAVRYALGTLAAIALSAWLALYLGSRIAAPMHSLIRAARRVSLGHFDLRADERGPRELVQVAMGFNRMLDKLPAAEQRLRESEERLRSLVEMAPDGIVVTEEGEIAYANPGFRQMAGLEPGVDLARTDFMAFVDPASRPAVARRLAALYAQPGTCAPLEIGMLRADGSRIEVEYASSSLRMRGRTVVQWHFNDVTQRNDARRRLQQANETLEARIRERTADLQATNEALEAFSYSVAHDLRGPLMAVDGFSRVMGGALARGDTAKAIAYAQRVTDNARTMERMIEGLLRLARAGSGELARAPLQMRPMVEEVIASQEGAKARFVVGPLPEVLADAATLRQVWSNLIGNAVKYSSHKADPIVRIACEERDCEFVFSVRDNGEGFDPEQRHKLFGMFQRLHDATQFEGNGIGLAVVRRIVERHGGRIWAEGTPGQGAVFAFTLPRVRQA